MPEGWPRHLLHQQVHRPMIQPAPQHYHLLRQLDPLFRPRRTVVGLLRRAAISLVSLALVVAIARAWVVQFQGMYLNAHFAERDR